MGMRKLDVLMELLIKHGRPGTCPAAVIQWASLPRLRKASADPGSSGPPKPQAAGRGPRDVRDLGTVASGPFRLKEARR